MQTLCFKFFLIWILSFLNLLFSLNLGVISYSSALNTLWQMNDVSEGGWTVFPRLGVGVAPQKGSAIFWWNLLPSGKGDERTLHAACPVLRGTKWGMYTQTVKVLPCNSIRQSGALLNFPKFPSFLTSMLHVSLTENTEEPLLSEFWIVLTEHILENYYNVITWLHSQPGSQSLMGSTIESWSFSTFTYSSPSFLLGWVHTGDISTS